MLLVDFLIVGGTRLLGVVIVSIFLFTLRVVNLDFLRL